MSYRSNVDEQVVKMSFDNSNFDSNINDSIKTLNSLDNKLASLNNANFSGLNSGMESLANFLTVKGQVMFGVLTRLGSEVVNFGIKAKNALFGGIRDGLGEYNTIINSTQTIFQNVRQSGATIKDVNAALDELNDYADLTIYNFGQMTNMIGKFTAAGVGLKKSVSTIKGLANAAALVGATPEKAEQAWQAVSRAMARGTFNLRTWYSLQTSSIASEQFVKVIKDVARANNALGKSGQNIDEMLEKYGSLEYTLSENWLTSDLFNEAMSILSGDLKREQLEQKGYTEEQINELLDIAEAAEEAATQIKTFRQLMDTLAEAMGSGWAQSFRILIGDLDQAKVLYTRISNVISELLDNSARIRNELFKQIMGDSKKEKTGIFAGLTTGRDSFKQTIENMMATVKTFLKAVKTGFLNIFPIERIATAARKAMDVIQKFTRAFVLNSEEAKQKVEGITGWDTSTIDKISESVKDLIRFFRGLASAVDIAWMAFSQPIKAIVKRIPFLNNFFENLGSGIKNITSGLGKFGDKITVIRNAFRNTNAIEKIVGYFLDNIEELGKKYPILGAILWVFNAIKTALTGIKDVFKSMNIKPLAMIFGAIKFIAESVWKIVNFIFGLLKTAKNSIDWSFLEGPKNAVIGFLKKLSDYGRGLISFEELVGKIGKKLKEIFSNLFSIFDKTNKESNKVVESTNKVQKAAGKTGSILKTIWEKIKAFFGSIGSFFGKMFEGADLSFEGIVKKIAAIGGGVLAASLGISHLAKTIGKIKVLNNLNGLLNAGTKVLQAYQKQIQSKTILNIAIAVGILAVAMAGLAFIPYNKLENGLVIFSSFMATLAITLTPIITAMAKFNDSLANVRESANKFTVIETLIKKFKSVFTKLARALEFRMLGKMFKDIAVSILILVGALTALVFLFKYEQDNLLKSAALVAGMIGIITASVFSLVLVIELLSKRTENLKASVGTFSSFFKLAGVARVIIAIAAAVLILAGAMAIMTKLDQTKLKEAYAMIFGLVAAIGVIAMVVAGITSLAEDTGQLKKIKVSMLGAMLGIALVLLAMKPLIDSLANENNGAWIKAIIIFTAVIGQFTAMSVVLFELAKRMYGTSTWYLKRFTQTIAVMTIALGAMAGILYIIGKMGNIPKSVIITLAILSATFLGIISVIALVSIVLSKAQSTFSGNFANVILSISVGISAIITSIGIFAAGIGALFYALSTMSSKDNNVEKSFTNILEKMSKLADILNKAVPKLREMFYNIGYSIGRVLVSFIYGIASGVVSTGEDLLAIADKFVNLIIDLLDKIVDILYVRKYDIARIIKRAIEFIITEITTVLNGVFKKSNGQGLFTEKGVGWLLGIFGVGAGISKITDKFTKFTSSLEKIKKAWKFIFKADWTSEMGLLDYLGTNNALLVERISNLKLIKSFGNAAASAISKLTGKKVEFDTSGVNVTLAKTAIAFAALAAAIKTVQLVSKGMSQLMGKELQTIRTDVTDVSSACMAFIEDSEMRTQSLIYGIAAVANTVVTAIVTVVRALIIICLNGLAMIAHVLDPLLKKMGKVVNLWASYYESTGKYSDEAIAKMREYADTLSDAENLLMEASDLAMQDIVTDWTFEGGPWNIEGVFDRAQQNALANSLGYEVGENLVEGEIAGINDNIVTLNTKLSEATQEGVDAVKKILDEHSPSKTFEEIYKNVMYGSINGIENNKDALYRHFKDVTNTLVGVAEGDSNAIQNALIDMYRIDPDAANEARKALDASSQEYLDIYKHYEEIGKKYGVDPGDSIRKTKYNGLEINQQLLKNVLETANTINDLTKEGIDSANLYTEIYTKAQEAGIEFTEQEVLNLISILRSASGKTDELAKFVLADFEKLDEVTTASVVEAIGKQRAASDLALIDVATNYANMGQIAEDHKEELIGLKQEEVQEKLKAEAVAAGMSEQAAEDSSRMITATLFAGVSDRTELLQSEFDYRIKLYRGDLINYNKYQNAKTAMEQEASRLREQLEENSANQAYVGMQEGKFEDTSSFLNALYGKQSDIEMNRFYQQMLNDTLADIDKLQAEAWGGIYDAAERAGVEDAEAWANGYVSQAMNILGKQQTNKRGGIMDILSNLWSSFGAKAPEIDTKWWNFTDTTDTDSTLTDSDISKAVDTAANLKDDLESQRADLTPTFDLDKLASDAQKANGIVMSSLMAAQNASIGDYINQDSELNPFMKDRWQNVYNFTQNNYSPKALSRIDIYRQTQRQLGMSRGL